MEDPLKPMKPKPVSSPASHRTPPASSSPLVGFSICGDGGMVAGEMEMEMLATLGDWQEVPGEPEYDLETFVVEVGRMPPIWVWNALVRQDLMPIPAVMGEEGWGTDGLEVVKTGQHFPIGSRISKGDLFSRSV